MARVEITSEKLFDEFIGKHGENLVVVYFWASWAPQCQQMSEIIDELVKDSRLHSVRFVGIEAEKVPEVATRYSIDSVPAFIFIRESKEIDRLVGASGPELNRKVHLEVQKHIPVKKNLDERLRDLVNHDTVMLFMKGTPHEPRCGFSKQAVALLNEYQVEYGSFDILSDNDVRDGLKKLSNWPTYPQLYVNGELVGGLDIMKELHASGELKTTLASKAGQSLEDRLTKLIKQSPVMLFMKGNADTPKCGFSKQIVQILNETGAKYGTFDILEDEEVRQGLKSFSNWPTYPQLYVNGELVGGLDIVKELKASGELTDVLGKVQG